MNRRSLLKTLGALVLAPLAAVLPQRPWKWRQIHDGPNHAIDERVISAFQFGPSWDHPDANPIDDIERFAEAHARARRIELELQRYIWS